MRDGREECAYGWEEPAEEHDACACRNGESVHNARERGESDVLAERCNRGAAEEAGNGTYETVAADGASHFDFVDLTLEGTAAKGAGVTDGFRGGDKVNRDNGENGTEVEFRSERKNPRKRDNAAVGKSGKINHAHAKREDIADDEAYQNGERTEESLRENLRE